MINLLMYITTSSSSQKWKRMGEYDTNDKNIQLGYRNGFRLRKMGKAHKEKWEKTNNVRIRTATSRNQNTWREGKFQE